MIMARWLQGRGLPALIVVVGLVLSAFMFVTTEHARRSADHEHMSGEIAQAELSLRGRMTYYEESLRGGVSLLRSSRSVERSEWAEFGHSLAIDQRFPGNPRHRVREAGALLGTCRMAARHARRRGAGLCRSCRPGSPRLALAPAGWRALRHHVHGAAG